MKQIVLQILKRRRLTAKQLTELKRRLASKRHLPPPSTAQLLAAYRQLVNKKSIQPRPNIEKLLCKRRIRTLSGVAIVTVLTKPWPCPGKCIYCPLEKGMPKSYLKNEPAAQRAYSNKFNPYEQVLVRLQTLYNNGHPTDKIELIVKGGSWNAYPWRYQQWFIKECFRAANDFARTGKKKNTALLEEQNKNQTAANRIIGLTLETRPDLITPASIKQMRALGCTRVELGVQHTDDAILKLVRRGHTLAQTKTATALLRQAGFKIDYHLMPQLPGSTPAKDYIMFKQVFVDADLRPDMIKIYPCTVVAGSLLARWFRTGRYHPYGQKQLFELLIKVKSQLIPYYCRISRLIRDIPSTSVLAGNRITNLREMLQADLKKRGLACRCLRCREIAHQKIPGHGQPQLFIERYGASGGQEYFLSLEDKKRQAVYAFCRLRVAGDGMYPAFIRELHTYGQMLELNQYSKKDSQHRGLGKKLMLEAEKICRENGVAKLAVIAGIGVREYYKKLEYRLENGYMVKNFIAQ